MVRVDDSTAVLSRKLAYRFSDTSLLVDALTHRSFGSRNNERLEFLGDSILNFVVAEDLYRRFPTSAEGQLSRLRAQLVRRETLAELARDYQLGDFVRLGPGELKSGGFRRDSILADTMEAVIGAVYLDGGMDAAKGIVLAALADYLADISPSNSLKDPKTQLQEYLQGRHEPLPIYNVTVVEGMDHNQLFRVSCSVVGLAEPVTGVGPSRRRAEQDAAAKAYAGLTSL